MEFTIVEFTISRTQVQLWGNRLEEDGEDFTDETLPRRQITSTIDEIMEGVKNMIWIIVESLLEKLLLTLAYCSVHAKQFRECYRHEKCASKYGSKIAKFAQEMLTTFKDNPDLLKEVTTIDN